MAWQIYIRIKQKELQSLSITNPPYYYSVSSKQEDLKEALIISYNTTASSNMNVVINILILLAIFQAVYSHQYENLRSGN